MAKRAKRETLVSPVGIAVWPRLNAPDTQFDDIGVYKVQLKLNPSDDGVQAFLDDLDARAEAGMEAAKEDAKPQYRKRIEIAYPPYAPEYDDEGDETGNVLVSFKMKAAFKKDDKLIPIRPKLFDAKGTKLAENVQIGGGSTLKVAFSPSPYVMKNVEAGLSLRLNAVQVLELQEFGGASAAAFGFGEEEGYETDTFESPTDAAPADDGGDEDEDF